MEEQRREILGKVKDGTLSPEEAAVRLQELEVEAEPESIAAEEDGRPAVTPDATIRVVRVVKRRGPAIIIGDPTIRGAVADGVHTASTDDDTLVITSEPDDDDPAFYFGFGGGRHRPARMGRPLRVRMNPALALHAEVQAGTLRVERVTGPIEADVQAGSARIEGFRESIDISVQAGSVRATGRLTQGASKIHCEAGSVRVDLERGSSVRVTARSTLGQVKIRGRGVDHNTIMVGRGARDAVFGKGDATLEIDATMGAVRVEVDE
jgi:hypothetical protein